MGDGDVGQHPLGHQLRPAIGVDRRLRHVLAHRHDFGDAVGRRSRGEEEVANAALDRALDEARTRNWVVVDMKQDWRVIFTPRR